jgi:hypothetical protein
MTEEYAFPPYAKAIGESLDRFGGTRLETYKGQDIRPFWDLSRGSISSSFGYLLSAPKLEKIVFSAQTFHEKLECYTCSIWPSDEYALPIFSSFWAESEKGSYLLVDFYPTSDCICDLPYLAHYLDPLEDIYFDAADDFPTRSQRDPSWFRTFTSPYYITADVAPSTAHSQGKILTLFKDYIDVYHRLWEQDEPREPGAMSRILERKGAIRKMLYEEDPGGKMLEQALGAEMTDLYLKMMF